MPEGYYVVWMSGTEFLDADYWVDKATRASVMRAASNRLRVSPHLMPQDATGFTVLDPGEWQKHRIEKVPKTSRKELLEQMDEMAEKYGSPPNDED